MASSQKGCLAILIVREALINTSFYQRFPRTNQNVYFAPTMNARPSSG